MYLYISPEKVAWFLIQHIFYVGDEEESNADIDTSINSIDKDRVKNQVPILEPIDVDEEQAGLPNS